MTRPGTNAIPWMSMERPTKPHVCAEVEFVHGWPADAATITCSCGWEGFLADWENHAPALRVSRASREHDYIGARGSMPNTRVIQP